MADWNEPTIDSSYEDFVDEIRARDEDVARMFDGVTASNLPEDTKRWNDANKRFEKWDGSAWVVLKLGVAGGGTGADTASGARTNLGLKAAATRDVGAAAADQVPDRSAADGRYSQRGNNLSDLTDAAAARGNLGLSSMAQVAGEAPTAADDFLVGALSPARWVRQTLAQAKAKLGLVVTQAALAVGFTLSGGSTTTATLTVDQDASVSELARRGWARSIQNSNFTIGVADGGTLFDCTAALTATLPDRASVMGQSFAVMQRGAGEVTIQAAGTDSIELSLSSIKIIERYDIIIFTAAPAVWKVDYQPRVAGVGGSRCVAWSSINCNNNAIQSSFNVSSANRNVSNGVITVNFSKGMPGTVYAVHLTVGISNPAAVYAPHIISRNEGNFTCYTHVFAPVPLTVAVFI